MPKDKPQTKTRPHSNTTHTVGRRKEASPWARIRQKNGRTKRLRLAVAKTALPAKAARDVSAIVPAKLMGMIQRVGDSDPQASGLAVKVTETQILIRTARAVLISSLVQGNFPKYTDVIPKETASKVLVEPGAFAHRIRQAALLTNAESKSVRLSFTAEELTLTSRAPETGEAEVKMPAKLEGDPLEVAFNPAFLIDALRVSMSASDRP